jgi:hypothetical protein
MPLSNPLCRTQYKAPAGEAAVEADRRLQRMQPLPQQQQHSPQQHGQQDPTSRPPCPHPPSVPQNLNLQAWWQALSTGTGTPLLCFLNPATALSAPCGKRSANALTASPGHW